MRSDHDDVLYEFDGTIPVGPNKRLLLFQKGYNIAIKRVSSKEIYEALIWMLSECHFFISLHRSILLSVYIIYL